MTARDGRAQRHRRAETRWRPPRDRSRDAEPQRLETSETSAQPREFARSRARRGGRLDGAEAHGANGYLALLFRAAHERAQRRSTAALGEPRTLGQSRPPAAAEAIGADKVGSRILASAHNICGRAEDADDTRHSALALVDGTSDWVGFTEHFLGDSRATSSRNFAQPLLAASRSRTMGSMVTDLDEVSTRRRRPADLAAAGRPFG